MPMPGPADSSEIAAKAKTHPLSATFNLIVVGAGINGAGIARDAAARGLSVALVEMKDIGNGTWSGNRPVVAAFFEDWPSIRDQRNVDWWQAVVKAIQSASSKIGAKRVAGLSIAHQRETFVCLDAEGEAIRPALLWLDTRAVEQIAAFGNAKVHELTGKPPNTATS